MIQENLTEESSAEVLDSEKTKSKKKEKPVIQAVEPEPEQKILVRFLTHCWRFIPTAKGRLAHICYEKNSVHFLTEKELNTLRCCEIIPPSRDITEQVKLYVEEYHR